MNRESYWRRLAISSALGVGLSYAFVFLAALPIRYLRLTFGRKTFLLSSIASFSVLGALGLWQWAFVYATICLLIGFYRELEEKHFSIFLASTIAVLTTAGMNLFALLGYSKVKGIQAREILLNNAQPVLEQLQQYPRFKEASLNSLLLYMPSAVVITMMVVLFVSLTVSRSPMSRQQHFEMRMFRLPEWLIWGFILGLAGTFIQTDWALMSMVATNVLAVTLAAYFFQGLAVLNDFLDRLSIFGFWRMLAIFLAFFQLFMFVIGLGILDYWFDFRSHDNTQLKKKKLK